MVRFSTGPSPIRHQKSERAVRVSDQSRSSPALGGGCCRRRRPARLLAVRCFLVAPRRQARAGASLEVLSFPSALAGREPLPARCHACGRGPLRRLAPVADSPRVVPALRHLIDRTRVRAAHMRRLNGSDRQLPHRRFVLAVSRMTMDVPDHRLVRARMHRRCAAGQLDHRLGGRDLLKGPDGGPRGLAGALLRPGGAHGIFCPSQS